MMRHKVAIFSASVARRRHDSTKFGWLGLAAFLAAMLLSAQPFAAASLEKSGLTNDGDTPSIVDGTPLVLSPDDVARYRRIFTLQEDGRWTQADRQIRQLRSDALMGHVLFQRYMHPTKYRSRYVELKKWMDAYADLPDADRIFRLALKRRPDNYKAPVRPVRPKSSMSYADVAPAGPIYRSSRARDKETRRQIRSIKRQITRNLRRDRPTAALKLLQRRDVARLLDEVERDQALAEIAASYFVNRLDKKAFDFAVDAAERSRHVVTKADWTAGLAAWRLRDFKAAQKHFEALATSATASPWDVAAGAFWAARAYLVDRQPERVNGLLEIAAVHTRTFYGQIAARTLGKDTGISWHRPPLRHTDASRLLDIPAVERAIALAQVGQHHLADRELRTAYLSSDRSVGVALLGLANRLGIPATQLRMARGVKDADGQPFDSALFPVPPWQPEGGFKVDRALVYAFMRQESGFNVRAKSHAGARGLMQLMPRTASYIAGDRSLRGSGKGKLFLPGLNMALGQKYLDYLNKHPAVRGNLFMMAVAYNGGPGNLERWLKSTPYEGDPLLFIESIPSKETRTFVERVLTNFWIYRERLGQDTPSLDAVATGHWPYYLKLDDSTLTVASNVQN